MNTTRNRLFFKQISYTICITFFSVVFSLKSNAHGVDIGADIKVKISRAETSEAQPNQGVDMSFDGLKATLYHSKWEGTEFPVVLTYFFDNVERIDYLIYHPRNRGNNNGNFMEFELWILAGDEQKEFVKYGNYDFAGSWLPSKIDFVEGIVSPHAIRFVVKSGSGDFVSCAEMSFYQKNTQTNIPQIFTDETCSELLPHIDIEIIQSIENKFYNRLATSLLKGNHKTQYRLWEISPFHTGFNCKSISVKKGDEIILFVENTDGGNMFLGIYGGGGDIYLLQEGPNRLIAGHTGLLCPSYINDNANAKPAKIHFATGKIEKRHFRQLSRGTRNSEKIAEKSLKKAEFYAEDIDWSKTLTPKQMKVDIDFFFKFVSKSHLNKYAFVSKDSMKTRRKELYNKCSKPMTVKEFHFQITQLNGMFDAHTGIPFDFSQYISADLLFPADIKVIERQLFIKNNDSYEKVLFINELCVEELFTTISSIFYQKDKSEQMQDLQLTVLFPFLLYHITDVRSPFTLRVETADSEITEYTVQGTHGEEIDANQTLFPDRLRDFRIYKADSIAIIEYNFCRDYDNFSNWVDSVFQKISEEEIRYLFIDISRNGGGSTIPNKLIYDKIEQIGFFYFVYLKQRMSKYFLENEINSTLPMPVLQILARLKFGKVYEEKHKATYPATIGYNENVYLIQGTNTFSAALDMSAWFKNSGIGTIIGEETGGLSGSFSNALRNRLPNSKIHIRSSSNYIEYPGGKPDRGIMPDILIALDYSKKYFELEDLKRFLEIIEAVNNKQQIL